MKLKIKEGTTSKLVRIFIQDSTSTTGDGLTGVAFGDLTAYWIAEGDATATAITLATMTVGTWASGGFKEIDATNMPGWYEVGLPNAVIDDTSEGSVGVMFKGATDMAVCNLEIELDKVDYRDTVRMGLTALPNAAADAAGGLPISDAGGLDMDAAAAAAATAVVGKVVEGAITIEQALRAFLAALAGKANGLETTTANFRDQADTKNRIQATVDADGNRTAITLDLT